jgi:CubicO group peptidase (beta-lactamase class C family)
VTMDSARISADRLSALRETVERDVADNLYWGAAIAVAHRGEVALDFAAGHADRDRTHQLRTDTVFSIFSATKAFINVLVLRSVELGRFALTTRMSEIIPEFSGAPRDRATIFHFLTHTTGMPGVWEVRPGMYLDNLDEWVQAVCETIQGNVEPGERCDYSPMANHVLLADVLRRTDPGKRPIAEILEQDLFIPLGMDDTRLGIKPHMRERHAFPDMRGTVAVRHLSRTAPGDNGIFAAESNEAVWVGSASTTRDLTRFADMLRRGGELDGHRILSPRMISLARRNWTGELRNEIYRAVALRAGYPPPPAYMGLGFSVRGDALVRHQFGTLTSPETFGNYGAGSTVYWIDPALDLTFVGLSAGLLSQAANIDRFQRLSDIAVAAVS